MTEQTDRAQFLGENLESPEKNITGSKTKKRRER